MTLSLRGAGLFVVHGWVCRAVMAHLVPIFRKRHPFFLKTFCFYVS